MQNKDLYSVTRLISNGQSKGEWDFELFNAVVNHLERYSDFGCPNLVGLYAVIEDAIRYHNHREAYMQKIYDLLEEQKKRKELRWKTLALKPINKKRNHRILQFILSRRWDQNGQRNNILFKNVAAILWLGDYSKSDIDVVVEHLIDRCDGKKMREVYNWFKFFERKVGRGGKVYVGVKELRRFWGRYDKKVAV